MVLGGAYWVGIVMVLGGAYWVGIVMVLGEAYWVGIVMVLGEAYWVGIVIVLGDAYGVVMVMVLGGAYWVGIVTVLGEDFFLLVGDNGCFLIDSDGDDNGGGVWGVTVKFYPAYLPPLRLSLDLVPGLTIALQGLVCFVRSLSTL